MKTLKIKVIGRVQGQSFRVNTRRFCGEHGLNGLVRNMDDGSVEIVVQGLEKELKEFVDWIRKSLGLSKVEIVDVKEIEGEKYEGFKIMRDGNIFEDQKKALGNLIRKI